MQEKNRPPFKLGEVEKFLERQAAYYYPLSWETAEDLLLIYAVAESGNVDKKKVILA
jgi:hypothetical protein